MPVQAAQQRETSQGHGVALAVAVILVGLFGRAVIDKIFALRTGPESVAFWAQLQSVADLVVAVSAAGLAPGLTVLVTQSSHRSPRHLLRAALRYGLGVSAVAMLVVVALAGRISEWFTGGAVAPSMVAFAALAGCGLVVPGLLVAYWLGLGRRDRILWLGAATTLAMSAAAYFAPGGAIPLAVLAAQLAPALIAGAMLFVGLRRAPAGGEPASDIDVRRLLRYLPIGLSTGILTPLAALVARSALSEGLSWGDAGTVQALWRATEWITHLAAGLVSLVFLPRFSASWQSAHFKAELARAMLMTLTISAVPLLFLWFGQRQVLVVLYDARFVMPDRAAALFLLGEWLRIASWILLNALFAMQRTTPVVFGEVLSLPLFAALLILFPGNLTLEGAGALFAATYAVYFAFNATVVLRSLRRVPASRD